MPDFDRWFADYPPSVRYGNRRKRAEWRVKGWCERVALRLAPWLAVPYRAERDEAFKMLAEVAYGSRDAVWTSPRVLVKTALEEAGRRGRKVDLLVTPEVKRRYARVLESHGIEPSAVLGGTPGIWMTAEWRRLAEGWAGLINEYGNADDLDRAIAAKLGANVDETGWWVTLPWTSDNRRAP